jgi:hypothetical protein
VRSGEEVVGRRKEKGMVRMESKKGEGKSDPHLNI